MPPSNIASNSAGRISACLIVTTDQHRIGSMIDAVRRLRASRGIGPALFLFNTFDNLRNADPLECEWLDGNRQTAKLI